MRFPAEWERHERTLMGWPCRRELWGETLVQARADYATVANTIAEFEPVTMIANPGAEAEQARAACSGPVDVVELPIDDSWLRDSGPIYVTDDSDGRLAVHFGFNAWGRKFMPWDRDAEIGRLVALELGDEVREAPMILEGGSVHSDGAGTILTTEQCLLNPNRNPGMSREQIELTLADELGAERVVWLGNGLIEDRDTDGHVDMIAAFTPGGEMLLQTVADDNPNYADCEENRLRLEAAGIAVTEFPHLPYVEVAGEITVNTYLNFYVCNGAVIVPIADVETDADALARIAAAFPQHEVVGVPGAVLAHGGGGPHCITQQVPAVGRAGAQTHDGR
jgi:agmatine deiminase